jgi:hypothetical protein
MKKFLLRFFLAATLTLLTISLSYSAGAQQPDQDPAPASRHSAGQQSQQNEAQMPSSGDTTTNEAQAFTGRITKESGEIVLKDPVTKVSYKLNDQAKANRYLGKRVKITGKLQMNSNTILVDSIEPVS